MAASIYETAATFGGSKSPRRAVLSSVTIPEVKKRRQPTKHYVYKVVVEWSNGTSTVIYRRYSMFFDFLVKLQELHSSLKEKNPQFQGEGPLQLPELPGKILFGRSHIHQVAEKRRGKIEEFCTALVSLPPEISESSLVLGFFNTWPDDTLQRSYSITSKPSSSSFHTSSSSDIIISHPDEMDKLEQYRAITDYKRANTHQVDLEAGQIVHVIEKHDTGWWMIVTDEEQGYAPAVCLEAIDKTYEEFFPAEPEAARPNEVFVAMESYAAENDDEVGFMAGDKIEVVNKNMDGWWKIRKGGKLGYCPAALIRRIIEEADQQQQEQDNIYESAKAIYEGLNIHRPPPRKNTIKRRHFPISQPQSTPSANRTSRSPSSSPEADSHYKVPRPIAHSTSTVREEDRSAHVHPFSTSAPTGSLSPNHYEIGPCFASEGPIYENTDFDDSNAQKDDTELFRPIYQNMDFDGPEKQQQSAGKKAGVECKKVEELDEDYINPEEFKIVQEVASSTTSNDSATQKPTTPVKQPPVAARPKLKGTKSLVVPKETQGAISDEEYIEMDSVICPEEEPLHTPVTSSANASPKRTTPNASPSHYAGRKYAARGSEGQLTGLPKGRVIERTKSLEDVLSGMSTREQNRKQSPLAERKFRAPFQLGRNAPGSPPPAPYTSNNSIGSDQVDGPRTPTTKQPKPEPAKKIAGKKMYHKLSLPPPPEQESRANNPTPPLITPSHCIPAAAPPFSPSIVTRSPLTQAVPKTYVAIEQYQSQGQGCLSFREGDKCVLVNSVGPWWLVNIGGREGWTPAEFWQADQRAGTVSFVQPPALPPMRLVQGSKPRSHTVMGALPEPPSQTSHDNFVNSHSGIAGELAQRRRGPPKPKPLSTVDESPPLPPPRSSSSGQMNGHRTSPTNDYYHLADLQTTDNEAPWLVGTMEREKAEQFLMENGRQREFLIRERTARRGYYALSIRYHYSVKHFNIDPKPNGGYSMGVIQFNNLDDVVKHYQTNSLFVHDGQAVTIGQPVKRKSRNEKSNIQSP